MSDELMVREDNILAALVDEFTELAAESNALDDDGFCNYYLRVVNQCDGAEAKITEMAKSMLKEVENRRKALAFVHGREFERRVNEKLDAQPGKSKTVKFLLGKAGQRKVATKVEFVPELHAQTVSWASANLDDVWVGSIIKTPLVLLAISTLILKWHTNTIQVPYLSLRFAHFAYCLSYLTWQMGQAKRSQLRPMHLLR